MIALFESVNLGNNKPTAKQVGAVVHQQEYSSKHSILALANV